MEQPNGLLLPVIYILLCKARKVLFEQAAGARHTNKNTFIIAIWVLAVHRSGPSQTPELSAHRLFHCVIILGIHYRNEAMSWCI